MMIPARSGLKNGILIGNRDSGMPLHVLPTQTTLFANKPSLLMGLHILAFLTAVLLPYLLGLVVDPQ